MPLLLQVFREGDGHGVYMLVETAVLKAAPGIVVPCLVQNLQSPLQPVRAWNAEIAANFCDPVLVAPLVLLLSSGDGDGRAAAAIALGRQDGAPAREALRAALSRERDLEVRRLLVDLLES